MQNVISGAQSISLDAVPNLEILKAVPQSVPTPTAQFFKDLTLTWIEAWKVCDVAKLEELVADEFCFVSRRVKGMCIGKTGWLRMVIEQYTLEDYEVDFITVNIQEHTAIVVYRLMVLAKPNLNNLPEKYVVTDVWTLIDQRWQAVSRQPLVL